ncbi:acyltransferase [Mesorhizobium sp. CA14]|uniref:acyltransferase family protein n=1 Tax=Mesorhizobium sp. CA14 TaxID=2876642 RepID=UPI001CCFD6D1|nr:acyltransferase family protein [Mesorhizobium sp. CA14]MBZ9851952.1 acyltransferase [Mesorhizobium sp. CA14]
MNGNPGTLPTSSKAAELGCQENSAALPFAGHAGTALSNITSARSQYRPEIDGLRALAVSAVLLYHLRIAGFSGGFAGVDVFFVISGYLITSVVVAEDKSGCFSLARFYARRARRLLPAFFATLALSCIGVYLLFAPQHMDNFAQSLVATIFGASNVLFWRESGYFDLAARLKPLLHTWSLSVEWQFYLIWPLLLSALLAWYPQRMQWLITAIGALSFGLILAFQDGSFWPLAHTRVAEWVADGQATVFYNMPFRAFEFACGGALVWLPKPRSLIIHEFVMLVGLVLVLSAILIFDTGSGAPAWNMLLPAVGTAMALHADQARWTACVLRKPPALYIGRISYSLYLVHWPLIVFCEYGLLRSLLPAEAALVGLLSLILAALMFHLIEEPYRKGRFLITPLRLSLGGLAIFGAVSYAMSGGMPWRIQHLAAGDEFVDTSALKAITGSLACEDFCEFGNLRSPRKILVVGDSHIDHYTRALAELGGHEFHFLLAQAGNCYFGADLQTRTTGAITRHCRAANGQAARWLQAGGILAIVQGQRWPGYRNLLERKADGAPVDLPDLEKLFPAMLRDLAKLYAGFRGPVILIGNAPNTNLICALRPTYLSLPCPIPSRVEHFAFKAAFDAFARTHPDFDMVDPVDTICSAVKCSVTDGQGHSLYVDDHHLSIFGARLVVPKIIQRLETDLSVSTRQPSSQSTKR